MKKYLLIFVVLILALGWMYFKNKSLNVCGGFEGKMCPTGYECKGMNSYPDASGYCVKT